MAISIEELKEPAQLKNLLEGVFDHKINPDYLAAFLNCPRHFMFIARDGDKVVGMVSGVEYFHPDKAPQMWINEVGVAPEYQNQKIGRRLVQTIVDHAEEKGHTYAWLGTDVSNKAGQACFNAVPEGEPPQEFLLYEWDLEED